MRITRIYADSSGESHFEDVEAAMTPVAAEPPALPLRISLPAIPAQVLFAELPPDWLGDWHPAPRRQYWLGVAGTVEVTVSDGETRTFGPGSVALLEDLTGKGHRTRVVSVEGARAVFLHL